MALKNNFSEQFILELLRKEHDIEDDVLKAVLLGTGFVFNPTTHSTYANVSSYELPTANGYTQNDKTLTTVAASISSGSVIVTADNVSWTATAGTTIGPALACCVYNSTHASDTIVCCFEFGSINGTNTAPIELTLTAGWVKFNVNYLAT